MKPPRIPRRRGRGARRSAAFLAALIAVTAGLGAASAAGSSDGAVTDVTATTNVATASAGPATYTIGFTSTDALVGLQDTSAGVAGSSTITLTGPSGITWPADINCSDTYEVEDVTTGKTENLCNRSGTVTVSGSSVTFTDPTSVAAGDSVTIAVYGVTNPPHGGTISVSTSSDAAPVASPALSFDSSGAVSAVTARTDGATPSAGPTAYTIGFTSSDGLTGLQDTNAGLSGSSTITLTGPTGINWPSDVNCSDTYEVEDVTTQKTQNLCNRSGTVIVSGSGSSVTLTDPTSINPGDSVTITVYGVTNPPDGGPISVSTSSDPTAVASSPLSFSSGGAVTALTATSNEATASVGPATYTIGFTSSDGLTGLEDTNAGLSGSSTITLAGPAGTAWPSDVNCSATYVVRDDTTGNTQHLCNRYGTVTVSGSSVTLTDPTSVNAGDTVEISVYGVTNPPDGGTISVSTSSDPTSAASAPLTFDSSGAVSAVTATTNVATPSAGPTAYTIGFTSTDGLTGLQDTPGDGIGVANASTITLTGPTGTTWPSDANCSDTYLVTDTTTGEALNLCNRNGTVTVSGSSVTFTDPTSISYGDSVTITVYGVTNPPDGGTISVSTSSDPTVVASSPPLAFNSGGEVSAVVATTSLATPSSGPASYAIGFTSTDGLTGLEDQSGIVASDASTITLTGPSGITWPSDSGCDGSYQVTDDQTDDTQSLCDDGTATVNGASVTFTDPTSVGAGDPVTVTVDGVTNAPSGGDISVSTSSDDVPVAASVPTAISATPGNASATVSWSAPAGVSGITGYVITPYIGSAQQSAFTATTATTSATIGGLQNGTTYTFEVAAITAGGLFGFDSAASNAITPNEQPASGPPSEQPASGPPSEQPASGPPSIAFSTNSLDFGTIGTSKTSGAQQLALSNTGDQALQISSVAKAGADASEFTLIHDGCSGTTVLSGQDCSVSLTFTPGAAGPQTAQLSFTDNAAASPQTVLLSGSGTDLGSLTGMVQNGAHGDAAVAGASLSICPQVGSNTSGACRSATTGPGGTYSFSGLQAGSWLVQVTSPTTALFGASGTVKIVAGSQSQNFTLQSPVAPPASVAFTGAVGASGGLPVVNWNQPFTVSGTLDLPTRDDPGTHGYITYGAVTSTDGSYSLEQAIIFNAHYGSNGHLDGISKVVTGQLIQSDSSGGSSPQRDGRAPQASIAAACPKWGLTPGVNGGVNLHLGGVNFTLVPIAVNVPPTAFNTGNSGLDAGLAMATNLTANTALNGAVPEVGAYNTVIAGLNAASQIANGNAVAGITEGVPLVITQMMGFGLGSTLHGGAAFTSGMATGLANGLTGAYAPSRNCGQKPPFPPLPFNFWIDPSGKVLAQHGRPLAGAKVVLSRGAVMHGKLTKVRSGSTVMSPSNRRNPSHTDQLGNFGWDVTPGYYRITASDRGCRAAASKRRKVASTQVFAVPPPRANLILRLDCMHLPRQTRTRTSLTVRGAHHLYTLYARVTSTTRPLGDVTFYDGRRQLGSVTVNPKTRIAQLGTYLAPGHRHRIAASYGGTAGQAPSRSRSTSP
ncbi:MAG: beta strand repeat-containing protein [Solirubrobacteraceae bacterium]